MDVNGTENQRVRRWRLRAEECRTMADSITDQAARSTLLGIADGYERLAAQIDVQPIAAQ